MLYTTDAPKGIRDSLAILKHFHWADFNNEPINDWKAIASSLLSIPMAHQLIGFYTVADNADGVLKVMRSYQYYAASAISDVVSKTKWDSGKQRGGYIWHTTGSGKTMTSFKSAQLIANSNDADKVIFLTDRIELGTQSLKEYRAFADENETVQATENTYVLLSKLKSNATADKFGEVFDCTVPNNTLSRAELSYDEGTVLNVHYGDVLIKYGSVLDVQKDDIPRIPHRCREDFNGALLQDGDVIIADTAEDETTGKACEIGNLQGSAIVSGLHTMVCRPRNRMALGYLGYYLNSNAYHHQLLPLMQGIKVLSLSRSNIQKTSVSYPTAVKEQQLIAYYFSQLDNLITLHQRQTIVYAVIRSMRKVILAERQYFAPPMVRKFP